MKIITYLSTVVLIAMFSSAMAAPCPRGQHDDLDKLGYAEIDITRMCGNASALFERAYNAKESGDLRSSQQLFEIGIRMEPGNALGQKYLREVKDALALAQRDCKVFPVNGVSGAFACLSTAFDGGACKVFPFFGVAGKDGIIIDSPFWGGCKDGLANGQGGYTVSFIQTGSNAGTTSNVRPVFVVKGEFRGGQLNGNATIAMTYPDGNRVLEGEFRENRMWNTVLRAEYKYGKRLAIEMRSGVRFSLCSSDGQGEQDCTDRDRLLGAR